MRRAYTLIFIGYISLSGFVVHAQPVGSSSVNPTFLSSSSTGSSGTFAGVTTYEISSSMMDTSAIEQGLLDMDIVVPEVSQPIVEAVDSKTKRNTPRLKINFAEFPLRSLDVPSGRSAAKPPAEIVVQRMQDRLKTSSIDLVIRNRTAIISGTVPSERQRGLAETMLRFEPGIDVIQNNITVKTL